MKTKIVLILCCLLTITSFSQDSVFQLKDYKYRTKGYTALLFTTSFDGGITDQKTTADTVKGRSFQLYPTLISYSRTVSTDKKLSTSSLSCNPTFSFSKEKRNSIDNENNNGSAYVNWQFDNRFFQKNNWFLQLGNRLAGEVNQSKHSEDVATNTYTQLTLTDELVLGFGKGRIEMVQDAQMALFILNDLKDEGLIEHKPDANTINQFAKMITDINNKRVFDYRRKRIYELTQIESFLREKGITGVTDIRHFTIVNDNWALAYDPQRSSGSDWFFHIKPSAQINNSKTITESPTLEYFLKNKNQSWGISPELGYENYKPINLKWQRNFGSAFSWTLYKYVLNSKTVYGTVTTEHKFSSYENQALLRIYYSLDYYPNNRTRLNSSLNLNSRYSPYDNGISKYSISIHPFLNFSTDYFLSYRTRLSANFTFDYKYDRAKNTLSPSSTLHNLNSYIGMSITHSFL